MLVKIYGKEYYLNEQLLRPSFSLKELANNQGDSSKPQFIIDEKVDTFLDMLQEFRNWYNKPMVINSCYRQPEYNAKVGGDFRSAHIHACAVDWWIKNHTDEQRTNVVNEWRTLCLKHKVVGMINLYTNGYHLEAFTDKWYGYKKFTVNDYREVKGKDW